VLFLQPWFWIYAAAAIPGYWICRPWLRPSWLILASVVFFFHFAGPAGVMPIIAPAAVGQQGRSRARPQLALRVLRWLD
jgi:hypothetical protein